MILSEDAVPAEGRKPQLRPGPTWRGCVSISGREAGAWAGASLPEEKGALGSTEGIVEKNHTHTQQTLPFGKSSRGRRIHATKEIAKLLVEASSVRTSPAAAFPRRMSSLSSFCHRNAELGAHSSNTIRPLQVRAGPQRQTLQELGWSLQ